MITHKYKLIFIHIPKCAGSSVERFIIDHADGVRGSEGHSRPREGLVMRREGLTKTINKYPKYKLFTTVRNPYDRFVSLWMHSNRSLGPYADRPTKNKNISLLDYAKLIHQNDPSQLSDFDKYHSILQTEFIIDLHPEEFWNVKLDQPQELNYILRFEKIEEDFSELCRDMNFSTNERLPHQFKSNRKKGYAEYYDDETRGIVAGKYAKDLEYFGYKF